jgi:bacillithiol system protein YtxJ
VRFALVILTMMIGLSVISVQSGKNNRVQSQVNGQKKKLNWIYLKTTAQLDQLFSGNNGRPALIFKHSTRCNISKGALERFESKWKQDKTNCDLYFVDVIMDRPISTAIAERSATIHHSPQALLVVDGKVIYNKTHEAISAREIMSILKKQMKK